MRSRLNSFKPFCVFRDPEQIILGADQYQVFPVKYPFIMAKKDQIDHKKKTVDLDVLCKTSVCRKRVNKNL